MSKFVFGGANPRKLWNSNPAQRPTISQISSQLQFLTRQHFRLSQQLEVERQTQHVAAVLFAAATSVYVDMSYALAPSAPQKLTRSCSIDSLETIETSPLSGDSMEF